MLMLCGFSLSNYFNKVKMALLEKGVPFSEEVVKTGLKDEGTLSASPLGKIPFIRTDEGTLCESQAIMEYLDDKYPEPRLTPADPWQAAKVRELVVFIDLHLELVARELYPKAFFGGTISEGNAERVRKLLRRTSPVSSDSRSSRRSSPARRSLKPTARPGRVFRWSAWRPRRSTATTC